MGQRFQAFVQHRGGGGEQRVGTERGSVGDIEARGEGRRSARRQPAGWRSSGVRPEEGDDPGGSVLGRKVSVAWADFRKFQGKSRRAAKATGQN
jgi:hypothetical protein